MNTSQRVHNKHLLIISAWAAMLLISDLPDVFLDATLGRVPEWLFWAKVAFLAFSVGLCWVWKRLRPLWQFALVMLVFYLALEASNWVDQTVWWQSHFRGSRVSFTQGYLGFSLRDLGIAGAVIAALWLVKRRRGAFFLTRGQLDASIEPVRWLGIRQGESWRSFGWIFAGVASLIVFFPTVLAIKPSADALVQAAPLVPTVLLLAAVNAFTEEAYFRAALLSTLHQEVGKTHALLISAVFFGLAHYLYGSPPGIIGFLMTGFLGWLLGKSMLETKGFFWPWLIHLLPDVVVFLSYALLWVQG